MANLTESPIYEPGIFQLEKTTPPLGGAPAFNGSNPSAGHANVQALQLANRTAYLKQQLEAVGSAATLESNLANSTDPSKGANKIGWDSTNVGDQIDLDRKISDYGSLRAYTGTASRVYITASGYEGYYKSLGAVSGYTDTGGLHVISTNGVVWQRDFVGNIQAKWFRDGTGDDTSASSKAAKAAVSWALDSDGDYPLVPYCPWATVELPTGVWTLTSEVDTGNREIVWITPVGCQLIGASFINGRILRAGSKITDFHHGILDSATSFSVMANRKLDEVAPVGGIGTASRLSNTNGRDTVGAYIGNKIPAPVYTAASVSSYTSTSVNLSTPMTSTEMSRMRRGMIIHTKHSTRYAGYVGSWTNTTINVYGGWFLMDGSAVGTPTTPIGTDGVDVNVFRKAWALNANCFIDTASYGNEIVGSEIGVSNAKEQSTGMGGNVATYGQLLVSLKADANDYYNTYASLTGGKWVYGYGAIGGVRNAFYYNGGLGGSTDELQNLLLATNGAGTTFFTVDSLGNIEAGRRGGAVTSTWFLDGHSSGNVNDYDGRISLTGGTRANGAGVWSLTAGQVTMNAAATDFVGVPRPSVDNTYTLGQAARRWTTVYASTSTINTSDERVKEDKKDIDDLVLDAWSTVSYQQYKFTDAVVEKGRDKARIHFGVIAQRVKEAFESKGLDPFSYGLLCYDEWDSSDEVVESWEDKYEEIVVKEATYTEDPITGNVVMVEPEIRNRILVKEAGSTVIIPKTEAGNRYGVRYEEALCLEAALMRRTTKRLEDRLKILENK